MPRKPVILVICDYYLPGFESGGALRTLVNMVDRLGDRYDFRIITRDHDGQLVRSPYTTVKIGAWNRVGEADVYYLSKDQIRARKIVGLVREVSADAIYLNSFFGRLTILFLTLLRLRRVRQLPIILAPEGEFSPGALTLNPVRKRVYITHVKLLGLLSSFILKAASTSEKADIERMLGGSHDVRVAPNMPPRMIFENYDQANKPKKIVGRARMIFLSRFMRKKNFNWLLEHLRSVVGELSIDICGTLEDHDYWEDCLRITKSLPVNIKVQAIGPVPHEDVSETLAKYDFFILPTLGENFGHVFIEALASGCPLIISDRTPWRALEKHGIGWDLALEDPPVWIAVLNESVNMNNDSYQTMSASARAFALEWLSNPEIEKSNIKVLEGALGLKATKSIG